MFVVMAFVNPDPGKEEEMANRMRSFRNVLQTKSGLVKTLVLMERNGKELVGVSLWTDEAAYQAQWQVCKRHLRVLLPIG